MEEGEVGDTTGTLNDPPEEEAPDSTHLPPSTDEDVLLHAGILDSFYQGLRTSALEHVQDLKFRLTREKETQLQVQQEFYTEQVNDLTDQLNTMTSKAQELDKKCRTQRDSMFEQIDNFSLLYELSYKMYISEFSVKQIFVVWKLSVLKRRKYNHLSSIVRQLLNKRKVSKIFHKMHKATMRSMFDRKEQENKAQVGDLAKQVSQIIFNLYCLIF